MTVYRQTLEQQIAEARARLDRLPPRYREDLEAQMRALRERTRASTRRKGPDLSTPEGQVRDCGGW